MLDDAVLDTESALVVRARRGDGGACEELAHRHRKSAYLLALQLLGNRDDALDVAQDAMLRFFSTLNRFEVGRPVKPYLLQIVRNRVHDLYRRRKVRRHESIDAVDEDGLKRELVDEGVDLERDAGRAQLRRQLWKAMARLSEPHREILVLRDYHDLAYAEIAATLCIPIGTVMSRLHAARKNLRAEVAEELRELAAH